MREKRTRMTGRKTAAKSLRAEIEELEQRLSYDDDEIMVEESMDWMDDDMEVAPESMSYMDEELDVVDDSLLEESDEGLVEEIIEDGCGDFMRASEVDPSGVEEEITQDYLDAVEEVAHGTELATAPSISKVAPTRSKYASRLISASRRLDRVSDYLEKNGRKDLAFRIDKIADVVDQRINKLRRK